MCSRGIGLLCAVMLAAVAVGCGKHRGRSHGVSRRDAGGKSKDAGSADDASTPDSGASDSGGANDLEYPALEFAQIGAPRVISDKFSLAESPNWDHCTQSLLFVDV